MGADDWAREKSDKIVDEFGVESDRALRITDLVRRIVSAEDFEDVRNAGLVNSQFHQLFAEELVKSLASRDGGTLEARWNSLVKDFGLAEVAGDDLLLEPTDPDLDWERTFVAENGQTTTPKQAMKESWRYGATVEYEDEDILIDGVRYRPKEWTIGQLRKRAEFERWQEQTGVEPDAAMKQGMHDSLYSNPDQAEAYEEANELEVDGLAFAIWELGWADQVDGWEYSNDQGWRPEEDSSDEPDAPSADDEAENGERTGAMTLDDWGEEEKTSGE